MRSDLARRYECTLKYRQSSLMRYSVWSVLENYG